MEVGFLHGVENYHQGEVLFVQAAHDFLYAEKMQFMRLYLIFFSYLYKNFQINANFAKFVNTYNHTHHFLNGVPIHEDAKNFSWHEEIFEA